MSATQPIRNKKKLQDFKRFYLTQNNGRHPADTDLRNYTLTMLGLNTALRISDILHLTWTDVFNGKKVKSHIVVREQKTGKENRILLNAELRRILEEYYRRCHRKKDSPYLFPSPRKAGAPLSRFQAYRIIRRAAKEQGLEHISCHSLRKTFGYHAWKQGTQPALLMSIFNHSSWAVTTRYLGIAQDEKDQVYARIAL
ncbi:MAG: tyrosine-type recombinase/integrase [Firmicutes bacterium]|nr:tyrosine-type recombinase/integrase [Bacillota bacterium]